jgi:sugar phosphate isomerase/epimerase
MTTNGLLLGAETFLDSDDDPAALAQEHVRLGYTAALCPPSESGDAERIRAIRLAFQEAGVIIAEVGAWRNLMTPDETQRRKNLQYVIEQMAMADEVGARCCVNVAGSCDGASRSGPHPDNLSQEFFDATVENCRRIIDTVRPVRSFFAIEMKGWSLPDGPDSYLDLIRAVDRGAFAVHLDPINAINCPSRYYHNGAFIEECFRKLGRWIRSCHAKDLVWVNDGALHFEEAIPGRGGIDFRRYLQQVVAAGVPLIIEHLDGPIEYAEAWQFLTSLAGELRPLPPSGTDCAPISETDLGGARCGI